MSDATDTNPLKTKLDAMALAIANQITVGQPVPQEVLKAMEVLTGLSKWYGIRQKLTPEGDGEGDGIDGYQKALRAGTQAPRDQRGNGGRDDDEFGYLSAAGDPAEPERTNGRTGRRVGVKKNGTPGYPNGSEYRHDDDAGGPDLDRIMASLPRNIGGANRNRRGRGATGDSAAGGVGVGGADGAGNADAESDDTLGGDGV